MVEEVNSKMRKALIVCVIASMLCFSMPSIVSEGVNNNFEQDIVLPETSSDTIDILKNTATKYLNMDEDMYEPTLNSEQLCEPQPLLGGNQIFGLWINIVYNGESFQQQVPINPQTIKGKLTDPKYRTPILFDVDGDSEYDIETGFGFFRYGIEEIMSDGSTRNHPAWATVFDFMQIGDGLDDQLGELVVWQEFHVNLDILVSRSSERSSSTIFTRILERFKPGYFLNKLLERLEERGLHFKVLQNLLDRLKGRFSEYEQEETDEEYEIGPLAAERDYLVTRVGWRSPAGEKIPIRYEKKLAVGKTNIFRPLIFQKEMNPYDVISIASNDVMFGFQVFRQGMTQPTYDINFTVNFNPAVYTVAQFIPREGKITYYYHDVGPGNPLDITFSSNVLRGGDNEEEKEGSLSLTIHIDNPGAVSGEGKWMSFEPEILLDGSPLGGKLIYSASHKFEVGIIANSPRFEEKVELLGIPKSVVFKWGVDVEITVEQDEIIDGSVEGFVGLDMSSDFDDIIVYYPKANPKAPDVTCFRVSDIPSSRELRAGASLSLENASQLKIDIGGFVSHDMSSSLGDITLFWPKADPTDPDMPMLHVPGGSFSNHGEINAQATLNIDLNDFSNPENYIYARVARESNSNFGEIGFYLPNVEIPIVKVSDIPANAFAKGKFFWSKLEGHGRVERTSSGNVDPISFYMEFDKLTLSNVLQIGDGHVQTDFHINKDGYFNFDTSSDILGNTFEVKNEETQNSLGINVDTVSADDFRSAWSIDNSGEQLVVDDLELSGRLRIFKNFGVDIALDGKDVDFAGTWDAGDEGGFEIDFYQDEPTTIDLDLSNISNDFDLYGAVTVSDQIHFDVSWKWGEEGHFYINDDTNEANILSIELYATLQDQFGVDVKITDVSLYFHLDWIKDPDWWRPYWWLEYNVGGNIDHIDLLWFGTWYSII
jgi:hypothetical protein